MEMISGFTLKVGFKHSSLNLKWNSSFVFAIFLLPNHISYFLLIGYGLLKHRERGNSKFDSHEYREIPAMITPHSPTDSKLKYLFVK